MNRHAMRQAVFSDTGAESHIWVDQELKYDGENKPVLWVLTACGKLLKPKLMIDLAHNQIGCKRCRSVSARYGHKIGIASNG